MEKIFNINEELKKLPDKSGVYLMKNEKDNVIYVGKAKVLKNRVKQYFQNKHTDKKTIELVAHIFSFEYIVTTNEVEALILECNLIHKYMPKYNIQFKDGKSYPYIKITTKERYPRVFVTRNYVKDGNKYFGQYVNVGAVNEVIDLIYRIWQVRSCTLNLPKDIGRSRPCLNYHIKKCSAPCANYISENEYNQQINEIIDFLNGNNKEILKNLEQEMLSFSEDLAFEKAAITRDKIRAINKLSEKQNANIAKEKDADVIGISRDEKKCVVQIFLVRDGVLLGRDQFIIDNTGDSRIKILEEFIKQNYKETTYVPKNIIIEKDSEEIRLIEERLTILKGSKVSIIIPKKGENLKFLNMANENARITLTQFSEVIDREQRKTIGAMNEIAKALDLDNIERIEAYDISNTQGIQSVGSMVVFEKGKPKRSDYRKFKIKGIIGPDDYGSIEEVLTRRFARYFNEQKLEAHKQKFAILPDLILIDGGKGQVTSAIKALEKFNLKIPVAGMVKDDKHRTNGILFNKEEKILKKTSEGFKLLTRIQDEVHRFAIEYHRKLREKSVIRSELDNISGIGEKRKSALLKAFGSVENIKKAGFEDIAQVDGMNKGAAQKVVDYFRLS
ncbi:MAG: excinuclease ABC subunit UvrC [Lachnospirales bacterium]